MYYENVVDEDEQYMLYEDDNLHTEVQDEGPGTDDVTGSDQSEICEIPVTTKYGIVCYFRKQDEKTRDHTMNNLASWLTGSDIIHSEFYFTRHETTVSVDSSHPVYMRRDTTNKARYKDKDKWEGIVIWVPREQYYAAFNYCKKQLGKPFDSKGIYFYPFRQCCTSISGSSWVCSRLMAGALVSAGIFGPEVNPMQTSPADIYQILMRMKDIGTYPICKYDIRKRYYSKVMYT